MKNKSMKFMLLVTTLLVYNQQCLSMNFFYRQPKNHLDSQKERNFHFERVKNNISKGINDKNSRNVKKAINEAKGFGYINDILTLPIFGGGEKNTILIQAFKYGNKKIVKVITDELLLGDSDRLYSALANASGGNNTTLPLLACTSNNPEILKIILDVTQKNKKLLGYILSTIDPISKVTHFYEICTRGSAKLVKIIMNEIKDDEQAVKDILIKSLPNGKTVFSKICSNGSVDIVNTILNAIKNKQNLLKTILLRGAQNCNPLFSATENGNIAVLKAILNAAKNGNCLQNIINEQNESGKSALDIANAKKYYSIMWRLSYELSPTKSKVIMIGLNTVASGISASVSFAFRCIGYTFSAIGAAFNRAIIYSIKN